MNYYEVAPTRMIGKDIAVLTYQSVEKLAVGQIVVIPVGKRSLVGVVMRKVVRPDFKCKDIEKTLFKTPLPRGLLNLAGWLSEYYSTNLAAVWQTILPSGLNVKRRAVKSREKSVLQRKRTHFLLSDEQSRAVKNIMNSTATTTLLHGVTGSGKTAVYKELAKNLRAQGKSSIILVPEISLTSQLVAEFQNDFDDVFVFHSTMTEAERAITWGKILDLTSAENDSPIVVVGPRSAMFLPITNLGIIVIDECHEPSYKQELSPKYNALRAAAILAKNSGSKLVLGSATPSVVDYRIADKQNCVVKMKKPARANAQKPTVTTIDMTKKENHAGAISPLLINKVKRTLEAKKQVLIFHNRRGTASFTLCEDCGWNAICPRCFVPLTLHGDRFHMRCHICGYSEKTPTVCPVCASTDIIHKGLGTKKLEEDLRRLFPTAKVARFDGDSKKGQRAHDLYQELYSGEIDIIIGTQTIAKGLDLPNLRLVGIPQADAGLLLPDFSARERTFQLISQAVGRVGRDKHPTEVVVQTFQPDSPVIKCGVAQDYDTFYASEIVERQKGHFPPFSFLLKLTNSYKTEKAAVQSAKKLGCLLATEPRAEIHLLGPAPAFYERARDNYRWQIVVRARNRADLIKIATEVPPTHWQIELDPNSLL
ncbi:MAG: primosomal protein N' [Candidatus Nomurabacteria bacterium]|jgi:primosomal protein N' (replication factor Y)|nr:primosomal protein N' [Candidatus Nomurabacteria bacterium]